MADPRLYLPPVLPLTSIRQLIDDLGLLGGLSLEIKELQTKAEYHRLWVVKVNARPQEATPGPAAAETPAPLVLRVAGRHLPEIKTLNEVATMNWIKCNTHIPIPDVVRFSAMDDNPIGHEFTLLEMATGVSVDTIYDELDEGKKTHLISQLIDYLTELHRHPWSYCGGLGFDGAAVMPARLVAETFWQAPEIDQFWGPGETVDSLNPGGPFPDLTSYVKTHMVLHMKCIDTHASLSWIRDLTPRLSAFLDFLNSQAQQLNGTRNILTHRDLHFGNIMCDPATANITAILDWEFSAVLPMPFWSPGASFLWNGGKTKESKEEQNRLLQKFESLCKERSPELLSDLKLKDQEPYTSILRVLNYMRAIVEVCPRGQKQDQVASWRVMAEAAMDNLGF